MAPTARRLKLPAMLRLSPLRGAAGALGWRLGALWWLLRTSPWRERIGFCRYALHELVRLAPVAGALAPEETWVRVAGQRWRVRVGRYELGGYADVWLRRSYELLPDFVARPGWSVVDVGANVGFFALRQAALGASVVAIEPNPDVRRRLERAVSENGFSHAVTVIAAAAGSASGVATLAVGASTLVGTLGPTERPRETHPVQVERLDDLLAATSGRIDLLKLDVEGAERDVLIGAPATLARTRRVVLEHHGPELRAAAHALLSAGGFQRIFAHGPIDYYARD
ncbi:MAG: FkbM family methyltransferase [Candidatus Limnocylindria bacterium]